MYATKRRAIFLAVQTGLTPATLTPEHALVVHNDPRETILDGSEISQAYATMGFSAPRTYPGDTYSSVEFSVDLSPGHGDWSTMTEANADTLLPNWARALECCSFANDLTPKTSSAFTLADEAFAMATIGFYADGVKHVISNAIGTASLEVKVGSLPTLKMRFIGKYHTPVAETPMVPNIPTPQPVPIKAGNTAITLGTTGECFSELSFDVGANTVKPNIACSDNDSRFYYDNREPTATAVIEEKAPVNGGYWERHGEFTSVKWTLNANDPNVGRRIEVSFPNAQIGKVTRTDQDGVQMLSIPLSLQSGPNGESELQIKVY